MKESANGRRDFLKRALGVAATTMAGGAFATRAVAGEREGHDSDTLGKGGVNGYVMRSSVEKHCGTCEFWGGQRRVSKDGKHLTVTSLGWCNNPNSPNFRKMTSPEHGPMDVWKKWSVLG